MNYEESEIMIVGNDLTPSSFDMKDLSEVLTSLDEMIISAAGDSPNETKICLKDIKEGSIKLHLATATVGLLSTIMPLIGDCIAEEKTNRLPYKTRKAISNLQKISEKNNCAICLPSNSTNRARIDKHTKVSFDAPIEGSTNIIATVIRAGGKSPKGMFEAPDGGVVYIDLTDDQAKLCGHSLYDKVILDGQGKWDPETYKLISFKPNSIKRREPVNIKESLGKLSKIFSQIDPSIYSDIRRNGGVL